MHHSPGRNTFSCAPRSRRNTPTRSETVPGKQSQDYQDSATLVFRATTAVLGRGELSLCESLAEARPTRHNVSQRPCPGLYRGPPACVGHRAEAITEASLAQPRRASCDLPFALVSCGVPCGVDGSPSSRSQNCSCVCGCGCHHECRARTRGRQRACDCRPLSRSAETTQLCSKLQGRPRQTARLRRECSVAGAHLVAAPAIVHNARQLVRVCVRRARQQPQQWSLRIFHHLSAADNFIRGQCGAGCVCVMDERQRPLPSHARLLLALQCLAGPGELLRVVGSGEHGPDARVEIVAVGGRRLVLRCCLHRLQSPLDSGELRLLGRNPRALLRPPAAEDTRTPLTSELQTPAKH